MRWMIKHIRSGSGFNGFTKFSILCAHFETWAVTGQSSHGKLSYPALTSSLFMETHITASRERKKVFVCALRNAAIVSPTGQWARGQHGKSEAFSIHIVWNNSSKKWHFTRRSETECGFTTILESLFVSYIHKRWKMHLFHLEMGIPDLQNELICQWIEAVRFRAR